ncbi:glycoside hydrolase family 6 protein [Nocardioides sp. SOB77]|uniref:Glucanase n=1 Tax=Nocardioides oceani TaxID=3058369 RepID=A0ABT8FIS2_9ACTN|nr:glycoside hydrolase family 6 protein [Nocardioides oceani]MDN4174568.1 glycoside hydrolase family 6 protein [Nocardioides oceani]
MTPPSVQESLRDALEQDRRDRRSRVVVGTVVVLALVGALVLGTTGVLSALGQHGRFEHEPAVVVTDGDPYTTMALYADPASETARAAATDARVAPLAAVPQGAWFTDWTDASTIRGSVAAYVGGASARHELPLVVLYRIPDRDCGGHASGGASDAEDYRAWVEGAARGIAGRPAIVVIEPDAVGQLDKCTGPERVDLLRFAVERMAATGAWVYIDAGHSDWWPAEEMARRLESVGIAGARGFVTNVANYHSADAEQSYAEDVVAALAARGTEDVRYLVDTGRSGGRVEAGERCNPPGARTGPAPALVFDGSLDGYAWVKPPAESDGPCAGGPPSGYYRQLALMLLGLPNSIED